MNYIHPEANVRDVIRAIKESGQYPVVMLQNKCYVIGIETIGRGAIVYTEFDTSGAPVNSTEARYASYHTIGQVIMNPVPKKVLNELVHTELPQVQTVMPLSQIIAGYL